MTPLPGLRFVLLQGPEKNNNANKNVIVILSRCHRNRFLGGKDRVIGTGTEVNPQSWTQHLLFICEEEH